MRSLSLRLLALWLLSLAASIAVALLLLQLSRQTSAAQAARAEAVVARACGLIGDRYAFYTAGWAGPAAVPSDAAFRAGLTAAVSLALARQDGVEGGIWQADAGPLAYAFPSSSAFAMWSNLGRYSASNILESFRTFPVWFLPVSRCCTMARPAFRLRRISSRRPASMTPLAVRVVQ